MARFNAAPRLGTRSAIQTIPGSGMATALGGAGYERDDHSELFLLSVSYMADPKGAFHEDGKARDSRYVELLHKVSVDTEWCLGFIGFLRNTANMRSASIVAAAEIVAARLQRKISGNRGIIAAALERADEPGELLAYWVSQYGRAIPKPVKRGIADALERLYTERAVIKWDSESKGYRFADVLQLVHPQPLGKVQAALYPHILNARYGSSKVEDTLPRLPILSAHAALMALPEAERRSVTAGQLAAAGMTWEALAGWAKGPMDAEQWEKIIPSMGYMALLRNLRNFDQAGISRTSARLVEDKLTSPAEVARSRQFPMRFLSAYRATKDSGTVTAWGPVIEEALNLSLANVPQLSGRTLVLVDLSGSMYQAKLSGNSDLRFADAAAVFGAALARRSEEADLFGFGWEPRRMQFDRVSSLLPLAEKITDTKVDGRSYGYPGLHAGLGGTDTTKAIRETFRPGYHDRIVIVTDEQYGFGYSQGSVDALLEDAGVPSYTWNLAGYKVAQSKSGSRKRHVFGGLTDASFRQIPLLEAGQSQSWPWLTKEQDHPTSDQ